MSTAAFSPGDAAQLTALSECSPDLGAPTGQADGSRLILLGARGDASDAVCTVVAGLVADGWQSARRPPTAV